MGNARIPQRRSLESHHVSPTWIREQPSFGESMPGNKGEKPAIASSVERKTRIVCGCDFEKRITPKFNRVHQGGLCSAQTNVRIER